MRIACPHCGRVGSLPDGTTPPKLVRCPACKEPFAPSPGGTLPSPKRPPGLPGNAPLPPTPIEPRVIEAVSRPAKLCEYCGESIAAVAKKCRHCGELLDPKLREAEERRRREASYERAAPQVVVHNNVVSQATSTAKAYARQPSSCGGCLLLLFLAWLFFFLIGRQSTPEPEPAPPAAPIGAEAEAEPPVPPTGPEGIAVATPVEPPSPTEGAREGRAFLREKLAELDRFKGSPEFHAKGFSGAGPFHAWHLATLEGSRNKAFSLYEASASWDLHLLASQYMRLGGAESDETRRLRASIEGVIGATAQSAPTPVDSMTEAPAEPPTPKSAGPRVATALKMARSLETVNRPNAVDRYREIVKGYPGSTEAAEAEARLAELAPEG